MLSWLGAQPQVGLQLEREAKETPSAILYTGQGRSLETLLQEAEGFSGLTATMHGALAQAYHRTQRYDEALAHYVEAVALYEQNMGGIKHDAQFWRDQIQMLIMERQVRQ